MPGIPRHTPIYTARQRRAGLFAGFQSVTFCGQKGKKESKNWNRLEYQHIYRG